MRRGARDYTCLCSNDGECIRKRPDATWGGGVRLKSLQARVVFLETYTNACRHWETQFENENILDISPPIFLFSNPHSTGEIMQPFFSKQNV